MSALLPKPKPCPFCGETPDVIPHNPEHDGNAWATVVCTNPPCVANPSVGDAEKVADDRGSDEYKRLAIERWNSALS